VFVLLSVSTLYIDSQPKSTGTAGFSKPQVASAPVTAPQNAQPEPQNAQPAPQNAQPAPSSAPVAARAAALAAAPVASPATGDAATRPGLANPEPLDQQAAAATSQRALTTPVPTPQPTAVRLPFTTAVPNATVDSAAPLRTAALVVGLLAVVTLLATLVVRHRLQHTASHL
jgi:hypothetical protein